MRLSRLNIKKINLNDIDKNYSGQDILMKLGELYQYESGIYGYGNLWTKLERIVENIIIEELDKVGCIQVEFPKLQPKKIWEQSNRWDMYTKEGDIMFTLDNNLGEYGLAPTAEECATLFGAARLPSYKNLPAIYYQIGEKFRKEIRTRGYLFRPRTFVMMDAYSFDKTEEDMKKTYDLMHEAYLNIFKRLGIKIMPTVSDNGVIGGSVAEEFQVATKLGEDTVLYDEEQNLGINKEVLEFDNKDDYLKQLNITDTSKLKEYQAVELGNNFQLGTKYSESMKLFFTDENGNNKPYYMGCYGIGVARVLAAYVEQHHDDAGIIFSQEIAPYEISIVIVNMKDEEQVALAEEMYQELLAQGRSVLLDDRNLRAGVKFKDMDLIGIPIRITVGRGASEGIVEIKNRDSADIVEVNRNQVLNFIR